MKLTFEQIESIWEDMTDGTYVDIHSMVENDIGIVSVLVMNISGETINSFSVDADGSIL